MSNNLKLIYNVDEDTDEEETEDESGTDNPKKYIDNTGTNRINKRSNSYLYVKKSNSLVNAIDIDDDDVETEDESDTVKKDLNKKLKTTHQTTTTNNGNKDSNDHSNPVLSLVDSIFQQARNNTLQLRSSNSNNNKNSNSHVNNSNSNKKKRPFEDDDEQDDELQYAIQLSLSGAGPSPIDMNKGTGETLYLNRFPGDMPNLSFPFTSLFKPGATKLMISGYSIDPMYLKEAIFSTQKGPIPTKIVMHYMPPDKAGTTVKNHVEIIRPPLSGQYSSMHSKLIIITYPDSLRVIIPSSNPTPFEYKCVGQITWFQDFKLIQNNNSNSIQDNSFKSSLRIMVNSFGISTGFLDDYDFSPAKADIIISLPGYHSGSKLNSYGQLQLKKKLQSYYSEKMKELGNDGKGVEKKLYYQCSSIGSIKGKWIEDFIDSCNATVTQPLQELTKPLHILYPTNSYVCRYQSRLMNSSILFLSKKTYDTKGFPKSSLNQITHKYKNRDNLLLHSKIIVGTSMINGKQRLDWIYAGSHNLSPAAWGSLQLNKTQLYIGNYEIGVILFNNNPYNDTSPPVWATSIPWTIPSIPYEAKDFPYIQANLS